MSGYVFIDKMKESIDQLSWDGKLSSKLSIVVETVAQRSFLVVIYPLPAAATTLKGFHPFKIRRTPSSELLLSTSDV